MTLKKQKTKNTMTAQIFFHLQNHPTLQEKVFQLSKRRRVCCWSIYIIILWCHLCGPVTLCQELVPPSAASHRRHHHPCIPPGPGDSGAPATVQSPAKVCESKQSHRIDS